MVRNQCRCPSVHTVSQLMFRIKIDASLCGDRMGNSSTNRCSFADIRFAQHCTEREAESEFPIWKCSSSHFVISTRDWIHWWATFGGQLSTQRLLTPLFISAFSVTLGCLVLHQRYKRRVENYLSLTKDMSTESGKKSTQFFPIDLDFSLFQIRLQ